MHRPSHLLFLCSSPPAPPFVNLIKAAIKQRFICLGPNLPYRHHVTTYAVHTCHVCVCVCSQPRLLPHCAAYTLTQPVPGTSTDSMSAVQAYRQHSYVWLEMCLSKDMLFFQQCFKQTNRPKVIQYVFISLSEKLNLCIRHAETKEKQKYSTMKMNSTVSKWK